jgi:hypothetical protein
MSLRFTSREARHEEREIHGAATELENAVVAFFWEGRKPRMGTLTVTLPDRNSSPRLGDRDRQLGLILGGQLAALTGKMALVRVNLPVGLGDETGKTLLELAKELIRKKGEENG